MQRHQTTLLPLLPWALERRANGLAAATDCDDRFESEPRIAHFAVQVVLLMFGCGWWLRGGSGVRTQFIARPK